MPGLVLTPRILSLLNGVIVHAHMHRSTCWRESAYVYKEEHSGVCAHTLASAAVLLNSHAHTLWMCPCAHMCVHIKRHTHMCSCTLAAILWGKHMHVHKQVCMYTQGNTLTDTHTCSLGELFVKIAAMNPFPVFTFFVISLLYIDLRFNPCD